MRASNLAIVTTVSLVLAGCGFKEGDLAADNSRKAVIILDFNDPCLIHVRSSGTVWDTEFAFTARIEGCTRAAPETDDAVEGSKPD
jgi:hypothetical protein